MDPLLETLLRRYAEIERWTSIRLPVNHAVASAVFAERDLVEAALARYQTPVDHTGSGPIARTRQDRG